MRISCLLLAILAPLAAAPDDLVVPRGQLTFDAEGNEGGRWHSRTPHVPSDSSGLTIGRGYDMKFRTATQIVQQLTSAGLTEADAKLYAGGAKLAGVQARAYLKSTPLPEITLAQQKALFAITYAEIEHSAKAICTSDAVERLYGKTAWDQLHPAIRDLVIDLRYRGDYTPTSRERIQKAIVANDLRALAASLNDRAQWPNVPLDRFKRRATFAQQALDAKK